MCALVCLLRLNFDGTTNIIIFFCNRPALSSDKALGFTTRSLHQCCRAQYSHPIYRVA